VDLIVKKVVGISGLFRPLIPGLRERGDLIGFKICILLVFRRECVV
jgi:hypothetical protein